MSDVANGRMPVAFFGHGTPVNAILTNRFTDAWADMGRRIGKPKAIRRTTGSLVLTP